MTINIVLQEKAWEPKYVQTGQLQETSPIMEEVSVHRRYFSRVHRSW